MSWVGLARTRAGLVAGGTLALLTFAVLAVHASASGAKARTQRAGAESGRLLHSLDKRDAAATTVGVDGSRRASAIVSGELVTVSCGERITASTTLTENLECPDEGLEILANDVVLNLNGHIIRGSDLEETRGVVARDAKDTVENGYIEGFEDGVELEGSGDAVSGVQATHATGEGITLAGPSEKATDNTAAENGDVGLTAVRSDDIVQSNHLLNDKIGLTASEIGSETKLLDNVADGNAEAGISVEGRLDTVTGNVADFNDGLGIAAISPQIDGGGNTATGNGTKEQCTGVVCAP